MSPQRTLAALLFACASALPAPPALAAHDCRAVYDAGSSGTRLYLYEERDHTLVEHEGPKVEPLADPIREIRNKQWSDAEATIDKVVGALDARDDPHWHGFDWGRECNLRSAAVYATAGMRIAEQERPERAAELWRRLKERLQARLGAGVEVRTRTLSGFEEGVFAWLALHDAGNGSDFGIVEIGGASVQVAYPCPDCAAAQPVRVDGAPRKIFAYSFLGLGSDEASRTVGGAGADGVPAGCEVGGKAPDRCAAALHLNAPAGIVDPYNYAPGGQRRGSAATLPSPPAGVDRWLGLGALKHYRPADQEAYCSGEKRDTFQPERACFRSVYIGKLLAAIGIAQYEKADTGWTRGAALCDRDDCLREAARECRWREQGCLAQ